MKRHIGIVALTLLGATICAAIVLASKYHLGVAQTTINILVGGGTLAGLYLAWETIRIAASDHKGLSSELSIAPLADTLADAVRNQWEAEARERRLHDPYPLPVRWEPTAPPLSDEWDTIIELSMNSPGWNAPDNRSTWAAGPADLSGSGHELAGVLAQIPTKRLIVLGDPGSGKTMLMVRLVLDLLALRVDGEPVPVLVSIGGWNPVQQSLDDWIAARLTIDYPALAVPVSAGSSESRMNALLSHGLILPILDGLDEIHHAVRGTAITRLNDSLRAGSGIVITSRSSSYIELLSLSESMPITLRGAIAIELQPLEPDVVAAYLRADSGGSLAINRWAPVLTALSSDTPLARVLTTPLMVSLLRAIYSPRPGEHDAVVWDPADLCTVPDEDMLKTQLFDGFIPAIYRRSLRKKSRRRNWSASQAERWLVFIARHLELTMISSDFAWWQLEAAASREVKKVLRSLYGGLAALVTWDVATRVTGTLYALLASGLCFLVVGRLLGTGFRQGRIPSVGTRWSLPLGLRAMALFGIPFAIIAGLGYGVMASLKTDRGPHLGFGGTSGVQFAIVSGVAFGLAAGLMFGLEGIPRNLASAATPRAVLVRDRGTALVVGPTAGLAFGIAAGLLTKLVFGLAGGVYAGLTAGIVIAILVSDREACWPRWILARYCLSRNLPWRLASFLNEAHKLGVLRQVGAVYQFRHAELQHRLATRHPIYTILLENKITDD